MPGKIGIAFLDFSGETSRVDINVADLTAGNIAATLATADPNTGTFGQALAALSLCTPKSHEVVAVKADDSNVLPTDANAQREMGLMVTYTDTVNGRLYRVTVPGPDMTTLAVSGTDSVNTAAAPWTAFVTAFEALAVSQDGNPVTVQGGRFVGRNR